MTPSEIQEFRKQRLQEAIDRFFEGRKINLARLLKNRHGEPLKDASYIGHLLKPIGEPAARPIDEDRIREIEGLRSELRGWFDLPSKTPNWHRSGQPDPEKRPSFPSNETAGFSRETLGSGQKSHLIPVTPQPPVVEALNWEQLMNLILEEGLGALESGLWVEIGDDSMAPELSPGDQAFFVRGPAPRAGSRVLVREAGGDILLREYRAITSKVWEAVPLNPAYGTLRSDEHGLEVLARLTKLTKIYA